MSQWPRITIVTPSYNQGFFLEETIRSIIFQGYDNLEYFVIDGGSSDNSVNIIQKYSEKIDWWVSEKDNGQTDAINKGFARATGELLCWINSDDVLLPGCLHAVAHCYSKQRQPDLIHTNYVYIDHNGYIIRALRVAKPIPFFVYRGVWTMATPATFFSASLLHQIGYLDPQYHLSMDIDIWLKIIKAGGKLASIPQYLGAFRWHKTSKTSQSVEAKKYKGQENPETKRILDAALPNVSEERRRLWHIGWKLYQVVNLNYIRAHLDTKRFKGQHWSEMN